MKHRADQPKQSEYHLQRAESCLLRHARLSVALCQEIFSAAIPHKAGGDIKRRATIVLTMSISDARDFLAAELGGGGGKGHNGTGPAVIRSRTAARSRGRKRRCGICGETR
jgi:hypothetical protein